MRVVCLDLKAVPCFPQILPTIVTVAIHGGGNAEILKQIIETIFKHC